MKCQGKLSEQLHLYHSSKHLSFPIKIIYVPVTWGWGQPQQACRTCFMCDSFQQTAAEGMVSMGHAWLCTVYLPQATWWLSGKASCSSVGDTGIKSHFLQSGHTSNFNTGTPVATFSNKCLALKGQSKNWLVQCLYTAAGWDSTFALLLQPQHCSTQNCFNRSIPEIDIACCRDNKQPRSNSFTCLPVPHCVPVWYTRYCMLLRW